MVQAITGIPFYYRQFGYEMAMGLGGGRQGNAGNVAKLKDGEVEPFRLRAWSRLICPLSWSWTWHAARQNLVYCTRDEPLWRYELWGKREKNGAGSTGSSSRRRPARLSACWAARSPCGARGWESSISN